MNIGILPSVNFTNQKRAAKLGISVCSRIIRLLSNLNKKPKKGCYSHKGRESDDKNAVAIVKNCTTSGLRLMMKQCFAG